MLASSPENKRPVVLKLDRKPSWPSCCLFFFCCCLSLKIRLHHSADYIVISFGIIELILVTLKLEYLISWCCRVAGYAALIANYIAEYEEI